MASPPSRRTPSFPDLDERMLRLERVVGAPGSRVLGESGSGLTAAVERLHDDIDATRKDLGARVDGVQQAIGGVEAQLRDVLIEIRKRNGGRGPATSPGRRGAVIAGVVALMTAFSTSVASVIAATRAPPQVATRAEASETRRVVPAQENGGTP